MALDIIITPENPTDSDKLICSVSGSSATYNFYWYKDEVKRKLTTGSSSTLESSYTTCDDTWKCIVFIPQSGFLPEVYVGENSVTIQCLPVCGDGVVNNNEECELPNTNNNAYCSQSQTTCQGKKQGSRDAYGDCDISCGCDYDPFTYQCVEGACNAECDSDNDCNDQNPYTLDYCDNECLCHNDPQPYCGDGIINLNEECELPNTYNNNYCSQSLTTCLGNKQGSRDAFGDCNSCCGCDYDPFTYQCVKGACGAECAVNSDCDDCDPYTDDFCNDNCICIYEQLPFCGDGIVNNNEDCEPPNTNDNLNCGQSQEKCQGYKLGIRDSYGDCGSNCVCTKDQFVFQCKQGKCNAECDSDDDCDDCDPYTNDFCNDNCICIHEQLQFCGDGIINNNEECELPTTQNNIYCSQSQEKCQGNKQGTRDAYGDCGSDCGCVFDIFDYQCIKGACGAECDSDDDCHDCNPNTIDYCDSDCICRHKYDPEFNISLVQGWNLISIPLIMSNNILPEPFIGLDFSAIFAYKDNSWYSYSRNVPKYLNNLQEVDETMGIWIQMNQDAILTLEGFEIDSTSISIQAEDNLIGYPSLTEHPITEVFDQIINDIDAVFRYDALGHKWDIYDPSVPDFMNTFFTMQPGYGYWVKTYTDTIWNFTDGIVID